MHAVLPNLEIEMKKEYSFSFSIELRGMEKLSFAPMGMNTEVKLTSDWPHPSFIGAYLPEHREINADGL